MTSLRTAAAEVLARIRDDEPWTAERFEDLSLLVHAAQRSAVPAYDAWCEHELRARGLERVRSWRDVPALPISAFRQLQVGEPGAVARATWTSSGTTASTRSRHALPSTELYDASIDAGVDAALLPDVAAGGRPPMRCIQLQPTGAQAPSSSLSHMYDRIRTGPRCADGGAYVDAGFDMDAQGAWDALRAATDADEPVLLLATSFALAILLEHAESARWPALQLPQRSRVVDTGGYKGRTRELSRPQLLERIERRLGADAGWCENEYGMSELSSQAWLGTVAASTGRPIAHPGGGMWTPPWLRVRVVDPVTLEEVGDGEPGLLVFHDLANAWTCAAVRSEDLGIRRGDGFELVGRAPGATLRGCSLRLEEMGTQAGAT